MLRHLRLPSSRPLAATMRALIPTSENPPHHLQRATVSGTAKGKPKLKEGQKLKRSIIPKKKTTPSAPSGEAPRGRAQNENLERLKRMVDSCLTAPTPIRRLTPKQRLREAQRETLGLISKDRQREIDQAKAKAKSKDESDDQVIMGTPGLDLITLGLVDADEVPKYELTVEDGRWLAKEYSRLLMRKHRARQAAETTFLRVKKEAIDALPEKLRAAALVPDLTPFPANRFMATLTPPIEGYIEKVREAAKKHNVKAKLR